MANNWIQGADINKGGLHRYLGIKEGTKIPKAKLAIQEADTPHVKRMKQLAATFAKMKGGK
jgi:hypothetical protein